MPRRPDFAIARASKRTFTPVFGKDKRAFTPGFGKESRPRRLIRATVVREGNMRRFQLLILLTLLAAATPARAQDVADFYRGKQLRMLVGSAVGGGYDLFARIVARHL